MTPLPNPFGIEISPLLKTWHFQFVGMKTALDIGCAHGSNAKYLASLGLQVDAIDKNLPNCESFDGVTFTREDILTYSLDKKYDMILALNVLQFLTDKDKYETMARLQHALAPCGLLFITSFTRKDPSYRNSRMIRSHFKEGELLNWAHRNNFIVKAYDEKVIQDCHEPIGEHQHGLVTLVAQKK